MAERPIKIAKSLCTCGHTGDGPDSEHETGVGPLSPGHGACKKCKCKKFTWSRFLPWFTAMMKGEA